MTKTALEKRRKSPLKERAQYAGALGIIGVMLWVANFPVFLLVFLGLMTLFVWKIFSSEGRNETRRIFEFYLASNEILREDDRRWYGFEIQETIAKGESIVASMSGAPPLVYFALGSLYHKIGDHSSAVKFLSQVAGENSGDETAVVYPAKELREYVRMLRKIERAPAEAPLTSSAIRALERARKHRGKKLLEESLSESANSTIQRLETTQQLGSVVDPHESDGSSAHNGFISLSAEGETLSSVEGGQDQIIERMAEPKESQKPNRKTISEVLHDIYDGNVQ